MPKRRPSTLVKHELVGLDVVVSDSTNQQIIGMRGKVIDETRNTLTLETSSGTKNVVKDQCVFLFTLPSGEAVEVNGKLLVARPEDRIKKRHKKW